MTRRQREGKGGKDHHGCGDALCLVCGNRRYHEGPTLAEIRAELDLVDEISTLLTEDLQ